MADLFDVRALERSKVADSEFGKRLRTHERQRLATASTCRSTARHTPGDVQVEEQVIWRGFVPILLFHLLAQLLCGKCRQRLDAVQHRNTPGIQLVKGELQQRGATGKAVLRGTGSEPWRGHGGWRVVLVAYEPGCRVAQVGETPLHCRHIGQATEAQQFERLEHGLKQQRNLLGKDVALDRLTRPRQALKTVVPRQFAPQRVTEISQGSEAARDTGRCAPQHHLPLIVVASDQQVTEHLVVLHRPTGQAGFHEVNRRLGSSSADQAANARLLLSIQSLQRQATQQCSPQQ